MNEFLDKTASLTPAVKKIVWNKATEYPFSGTFDRVMHNGTYLCRCCGLALFRADSQFSSGCGWPSFDANVLHAVELQADADGLRTEIICARCTAHLGHVFQGEHFTAKNTRHCVNSASLDFVIDSQVIDTQEAIVAGGCFWGVEHYLRHVPGVLLVESGYCGGSLVNPSYEQICQGNTGHYEAVRIVYDTNKINYTAVLKQFFSIHDPTQTNGQGPDLGEQYQSAVFYYNAQQQQVAEELINELIQRGYNVATQLHPTATFWPAEEYHQHYYKRHQKQPYCHHYVSRFK